MQTCNDFFQICLSLSFLQSKRVQVLFTAITVHCNYLTVQFSCNLNTLGVNSYMKTIAYEFDRSCWKKYNCLWFFLYISQRNALLGIDVRLGAHLICLISIFQFQGL